MALPCELVPVVVPAERPGSGVVNFGKGGVAGTRKWVVPWRDAWGNDYIDFVQRLLGKTIAGPGGMPAITYPDVFSAELPWLFCQEVDVEGEDCIGFDTWGRIAYRRAVLTAKYYPFEMGESFSLSTLALSLTEGDYSYLGKYLVPRPPVYQPKPRQPRQSPVPQGPLQGAGGQIMSGAVGQVANPFQAAAQATQQDTSLGEDAYGARITPPANPYVTAGQAGQAGTGLGQDAYGNPITPPANPYVTAGQAGQAGTGLGQGAYGDALNNTLAGGLFNLDLTGGIPGMSANVAAALQNAASTDVLGTSTVTTKPEEPQESWVAQMEAYQAQMLAFLASPGMSDADFKTYESGTVAQPVTKILPLGEYSLERQNVLAPNFWTFIAMLGSVNAFFFLGFPPWSLMFGGVDGKRTTLPNGTRAWDLSLKFHFNPNTWNMVYRASSGKWEIIATKQTSDEEFFLFDTAVKGQPASITTRIGPTHRYLYRPLDFSVFLLFA